MPSLRPASCWSVEVVYMRTDSVNLSKQALAQCKEEITKLYGEK